MEFKITLNWIARMRITQLMDETLKGRGLDPEYLTACEVYEKIYISDDENQTLSIKQANGTRTLDQEKIFVMKHEVSLDYKQMAKLEKLMTDFELKPGDRVLWWAKVMAQLQEAKKPELEDEPTRQRNLAAIRGAGRK